MYQSISTVSLGMFGIFRYTVENDFRQQKGGIRRCSICRMPDCLCVPFLTDKSYSEVSSEAGFFSRFKQTVTQTQQQHHGTWKDATPVVNCKWNWKLYILMDPGIINQEPLWKLDPL